MRYIIKDDKFSPLTQLEWIISFNIIENYLFIHPLLRQCQMYHQKLWIYFSNLDQIKNNLISLEILYLFIFLSAKAKYIIKNEIFILFPPTGWRILLRIVYLFFFSDKIKYIWKIWYLFLFQGKRDILWKIIYLFSYSGR